MQQSRSSGYLSPHVDKTMDGGEGGGRHSRQNSAVSPTCVFPSRMDTMTTTAESRGRRSSSTSSTASRGRGLNIVNGARPPTMNTAEVYDAMEKEQEAIVNKLQREISNLKTERSRSRSQSTSSSSSLSRNPSIRSNSAIISDAEENANPVSSNNNRSRGQSRPSFSGMMDDNVVSSLKKENEVLKRKLADLSIKLTEKDNEIERWKHLAGNGRKKSN